MKKRNKIFLLAFSCLFMICSATMPVKKARAGQDEFIAPLFSGYIENESKAALVSQNTVIDMSKYNGIGNIGDDVGEITATSSYFISNAQTGAIFCIPYVGTIDELNQIQITINGQVTKAERFYGEMPSYFAGDGQGFLSVEKAIETVQPTTLKEGMARIYSFAPIGGMLEYSFQKSTEQTVIHDGIGWSSQGVNGYSFKVNNSDMEEYPYRIFVSNGELIDFQSNIEYTISDISYQDYVDYYLNEIVAGIGEKYRPYFYSKFNRSLSGQVLDVGDTLFHFPHYTFTLMKIALPIGESEIIVNSIVSPFVNALYTPYIYIVRVISPYPQDCDYLLEIKLSEKLPYLLEDNIGLSKLIHSEKKQKADGYFVVSAENEVEYLLQEKQESNKKDSTVFYIICACGVGIALIVLLICKIKPQGA